MAKDTSLDRASALTSHLVSAEQCLCTDTIAYLSGGDEQVDPFS